MPSHVRCRTSDNSSAKVAWNAPSSRFFHLDTFSMFYRPALGLRSLAKLLDMSRESKNKWMFIIEFLELLKSFILTSNSMSNSYFSRLWMCQHFPIHLVPSLFDSSLNQSQSAALFFSTYCRLNFMIKINGAYIIIEVKVKFRWLLPWSEPNIPPSGAESTLCRVVMPLSAAVESLAEFFSSTRQP